MDLRTDYNLVRYLTYRTCSVYSVVISQLPYNSSYYYYWGNLWAMAHG